MREQPIFQVSNHHHDSAGRPPLLDDTTPNQYRGYFENEYGEQAIFIYDRTTRRGKLYMGDNGWETPYEIRNGEIVGLNLSPLEQSWLRLCWQAATWSKHYYSENKCADYLAHQCLNKRRITRKQPYFLKKNWPLLSACHAGMLADNRTPVGSVNTIYRIRNK